MKIVNGLEPHVKKTSWNPFNTFCQAQATSVGQTAPTATNSYN